MDEWERLERRRRIVCRAAGMAVGAAVLFLLLMFVARHSGMKAQDQFTLICERALHETEREGGR